MAHPGPNKGAQPRTLRGVALSKVEGKNLSDTPGYDAQGGHPVSAQHPLSVYQDDANQAKTKTSHPAKDTHAPVSFKGGK